jgi:hypothetical protein
VTAPTLPRPRLTHDARSSPVVDPVAIRRLLDGRDTTLTTRERRIFAAVAASAGWTTTQIMRAAKMNSVDVKRAVANPDPWILEVQDDPQAFHLH